jgi:hypothetical protein
LAEKKKLSRYRAGQYALEVKMRETWATGLTRYSQLCICRGRIRLKNDRAGTDKIHTELWGSGVYLNLYWFADELPPTIRDGEIATVIGNVHTFNLNNHVAMQNCMHVPKYGAALGKEIRELIARYVLTPKTYVPEEQLTVIKERIEKKHQERVAEWEKRGVFDKKVSTD